jgi:Family of unknown function (DUF6090)
MADHEVAKHTKKLYKIWNSSEHGLWHKFKEFLIEIFIIIFAVSVSIWFHNMSEKKHDRAEGLKFLIGLKSDLEKDIVEMKSDSTEYYKQLSVFIELTDTTTEYNDNNFIFRAKDVFTSTIFLVPNISRFEALKYSGKMSTIENTELLDEIINLYEEKIPRLVSDGRMASNYKTEEFVKFTEENKLYDNVSVIKIFPTLKSNKKLQFIFRNCKRTIKGVLNLYREVIIQNEKLIGMINEELKK